MDLKRVIISSIADTTYPFYVACTVSAPASRLPFLYATYIPQVLNLGAGLQVKKWMAAHRPAPGLPPGACGPWSTVHGPWPSPWTRTNHPLRSASQRQPSLLMGIQKLQGKPQHPQFPSIPPLAPFLHSFLGRLHLPNSPPAFVLCPHHPACLTPPPSTCGAAIPRMFARGTCATLPSQSRRGAVVRLAP